MTANQPKYDNIGSKYMEWDVETMRKYITSYTTFKYMLTPLLNEQGLLTGQRALDLACGEGYHTRRLKALNCSYVLGVDISSAMINLAREAERQDPKQIEYIIADAKQLPPPEQPFDLVTGFYLLNNAETRKELLEMACSAYAQLDKNKPFIGVTINVVAGKKVFDIDRFRKYGLTVHFQVPLDGDSIPDGTKLITTMYNKQDEIIDTLIDHYWSPMTYEQVFKEAGFTTFQWVPYQCDPDMPNREFYDYYIDCPHAIGVIATK
jgi:SAM-dependent methyltransferase